MPDSNDGRRVIDAAAAIREALDLVLARKPNAYVIGEGVCDPKAIFGTTAGLLDKYGPSRVVEMPVAENGLTGIAIGSALLGQRPIMIHQRVDFALLALEQLFNNAAKTHYVSNGKHSVPLVVRMIVGRGWGQGPAHSQSLESIFAHVPGLKVVMPSIPADCKGLLLGAVEDGNPVMFIEHRWIHYVKGAVAEGWTPIALDGPRHAARGNAATIVATSLMSIEAALAVEELARVGVECDVFDLRVLRPLNVAPIIESVRRTSRLVVVDTGWRTLGMGAEIVARIVESAFSSLVRAPVRLGLPDHPTPSSRAFTAGFYPTAETIAKSIAELVEIGAERVAPALERLRAAKSKISPDQPDPAFAGPF
ncbi:MAG: alpha-ketoacid dehydrogenase subunit beta [Azospirillum sp.]|nr:alpha-ketoacid dehydrogenase subunit beta [Azospirillum sp.]